MTEKKVAQETANEQTVVIYGLPFQHLTHNEIIPWIRGQIASTGLSYIVTADLDYVLKACQDPELHRILIEANLLVANGFPLVKLSSLFGPTIKELLTGPQLIKELALAAKNENWRIFFLGNQAERRTQQLSELGIKLCGSYSLPAQESIFEIDDAPLVKQIQELKPDILLIAFGRFQQEKWLNMHLRGWDIPLVISLDEQLLAREWPPLEIATWRQWFAQLWHYPPYSWLRICRNIWSFSAINLHLLFLRLLPSFSEASATPFLMLPPELEATVVTYPPLANENERRDFYNRQALKAQDSSLVVDISHSHWLNSRDLGMLVQLNRLCRNSGHKIYLIGANSQVKRLLRFTALDNYLEVVTDENELTKLLRQLQKATNAGDIIGSISGRFLLVLPDELTSVNLPLFRQQFTERWETFIQSGKAKSITIDASALTFLDSAALGFFITVKKLAKEKGISCTCFGLHDMARQLVNIANLEKALLQD